jgi:hypothetical protein
MARTSVKRGRCRESSCLVFFSGWRSLGVLGGAALNELTFLVPSISYPQQAVSKKFLIEDEQKMKVSERCRCGCAACLT